MKLISDISDRHPRGRQQSLVDIFEKLRQQADAGEIVGATVVYVEKDGTWHHVRDAWQKDMPTMLGYFMLLIQKLGHHYLTGESLGHEADNEEPQA